MRTKIKITDRQEDYLREKYNDRSYADMAVELGVSVQKIVSWLNELGLKKTRNAKSMVVNEAQYRQALDVISRYKKQLRKPRKIFRKQPKKYSFNWL